MLEKFGELGPVRRLFKFFFGRVFDNFIDREIKLSDFKNHILELDNLPLSVNKINRLYLADSPYRLHSGVIGKLRIKLASFKELTTKDIEVSLNRVHLVFKFNQSYHKPKKTYEQQKDKREEDAHHTMEIQEIDLYDEDDEDDEKGLGGDGGAGSDNSGGPSKGKKQQDMYKQFVRQVLSNIKLSVNDLVVDMFMNEPAKTPR